MNIAELPPPPIWFCLGSEDLFLSCRSWGPNTSVQSQWQAPLPVEPPLSFGGAPVRVPLKLVGFVSHRNISIASSLTVTVFSVKWENVPFVEDGHWKILGSQFSRKA